MSFNITANKSIGFGISLIRGQIKVWDGSAWTAKPAKVWNGTSWVTKPVKRWNGSAWVITPY